MLKLKRNKKLMIPVLAMVLVVAMAGNALASDSTYWSSGMPYTSKSTNTFYTSCAVQMSLYCYDHLSTSFTLGIDYYSNPIGYDGDFGSKTEEAVKLFQTDNCPPADGLVGSNTWNALRNQCFDDTWVVGDYFYMSSDWTRTIVINGVSIDTEDFEFFKKNQSNGDWYVYTSHGSYRVFANN